MAIHHVDRAALRPLDGRPRTGSSGLAVGRPVAHCVLVETAHGPMRSARVRVFCARDPHALSRMTATPVGS